MNRGHNVALTLREWKAERWFQQRVSPALAESGNRLSARADDTVALPRYELFPPSRWINARELEMAPAQVRPSGWVVMWSNMPG